MLRKGFWVALVLLTYMSTASAHPPRMGEVEILSHPAGCPHTLFCGCGASFYLFGKAVSRGGLAIAANWLKFPRALPGPRMAEVTRGGGHVRVIEASVGKGRYVFYDANSGNHQTHRYIDIIRGTVVNPGSHR